MRFSLAWFLLLCSLIFIIEIKPAAGQIYPFQNFSVREGLIHSNVYSIAQDQTGYMWFATENGLSRFDGLNFENKTLTDLGLTSYISSVYVDEKNQIYLGTGSDGIFKYNPYSEKIERVNKKPIAPSNQIVIKDDELISIQEIHFIEILSKKFGDIISADSIFIKNTDNKSLSILKLSNNSVLLGRSDGLYKFSENRQHKLTIKGLNNVPIYSIFETKDKSILVGSNGVIYKIVNEKVIDSISVFTGIDSRVRNIFIDSQNNLWFNRWGTKDIFMISENIIINVSEKLSLKNVPISRIFCDREGNIWVGTLGKGIFLFSNMYASNYISSNEKYSSNIKKIIQTSNHKLLLGTSDGIAFLNLETKDLWNGKHMPEISQYVRDITAIDKKDFVVAITDSRLKYPIEKKFKIPFDSLNVHYVHGSSLLKNEQELWIGNWDNSVLKYANKSFKYIGKNDSIFNNPANRLRINCFLNDNFNKVWIGSQNGLTIQSINPKRLNYLSFIKDREIFKIIDAGNNELLIVTNMGFLKIKNHIDPNQINIIERVDIPNTTCVAITGTEDYLVGTQNGLFVINKGKRTLLTINDGIPGESINDILYNDSSKTAWVATSEGLMELQLDKFIQFAKIIYPIDELIVKQNMVLFKNPNKISFPFSKNSITIKFQSFNYSNPRKLKYRYKIDDDPWIYAPTNELQFASLPPGEHIFKITTENSLSTVGPERILYLTIEPPFYRTWWFYTLSAFLSGLLIFLLTRRQIHLTKRKQEEKSISQQKFVELQQKALANNLNPHFIFNSLNSIQHFINAHNPKEANDYLSKFARLMRMQLNAADKSFITLHEELSRLEFYLNLEQMRFGKKLSFQMTLDPAIDSYTLEIPNMIIQPFVENAIWHGIMPSENPGNIDIKVNIRPNNELEIIITDNGVGYGQHKKEDGVKHESKGMKLITDRLQLLDPGFNEILSFGNNGPGTIVRLVLSPKMYRNDSANTTLPQ